MRGHPPVKRPHTSAAVESDPEDPPLLVRAGEAVRVLRLVDAGYAYREIGAMLGLATTTAWRRHRWAVEVLHSRDDAPLPSMRRVRPPSLPPVFLDWPDPEYYRLPDAARGAVSRPRPLWRPVPGVRDPRRRGVPHAWWVGAAGSAGGPDTAHARQGPDTARRP